MFLLAGMVIWWVEHCLASVFKAASSEEGGGTIIINNMLYLAGGRQSVL
jgi:hypothetical protein